MTATVPHLPWWLFSLVMAQVILLVVLLVLVVIGIRT
jgi:hypothetical protein